VEYVREEYVRENIRMSCCEVIIESDQKT